MTTAGFALFDTSIGCCGVVWAEAGIRGVTLPVLAPGEGAPAHDEQSAARAALTSEFPGFAERPPPPEVHAAIEAMTALMAGERVDLTDIVVDLRGLPEFHRRVYAVTRTIPPGETFTYGEVAARLGLPGAVRAVGQALGRNPVPIIVPCHRVLAAGGGIGGFSAPGGATTKRRILRVEGALPPAPPSLFDDLPFA